MKSTDEMNEQSFPDKPHSELQRYAAFEKERERLESILREGATGASKNLRKALMLAALTTVLTGVVSRGIIFTYLMGISLYIIMVASLIGSALILFFYDLSQVVQAKKQLKQWEVISNDCKIEAGRN